MTGTANDLNISEAGYVTFDGTSIFHGRTFQAGTGITITNASGVAGNTTISLTGGGVAVEHLTGNTGGQLNPDGSNNFNILTTNTTVKFAGSGSTLTQDFGLTNLLIGASGASITVGDSNVGVGLSSLASITSAISNVGVGNYALTSLTSGISNVGIGNQALYHLTTGQANVCVGEEAGTSITTSQFNTAMGHNALQILTTGFGVNTAYGDGALGVLQTGAYNVAIGNPAGSQYTTSESSNILIANTGVTGESNVMRLGTQGTSNAQVTQTYIAGVINTVSGRVVKITTPGAYPYTTLTTDYVILVDTSVARTIVPLGSPVTGTTYRIKDNVGSAAANNITVTPSGKNIDGAASTTINQNWASIDIVYNGTQWNVL